VQEGGAVGVGVAVDGDGDGGIAVFYPREHFAPEVSAFLVSYRVGVLGVSSPCLSILMRPALGGLEVEEDGW
jgi:hypothetical protein